MQAATEAAKLAAELSRTTAGPFGPMEQNLDDVRATQARLRRLTEAHERETFVRVLARLDADRIVDRLLKAMRARQSVFVTLRDREGEAAAAVNEALDRQTLIVAQLKDTPQSNEVRDLTKTLGRVRERLKWLDGVREGLSALHDRSGPGAKAVEAGGAVGSAVASAGKSAAASDKALSELLDSANKVLEGVEKDDRVGAAMQLVRRAAEQTAAAEQSRLLEFRRYLADLQRLRDHLAVRDVTAVCQLLVPAVFQVHPVASEKGKKELKEQMDALRASGRYRDQCEETMEAAVGENVADRIQRERDAVKRRWEGKTLAEYVAATLAGHKSEVPDTRATANATAPRLVAALGILLFHEGPFLSDARLDVERALHRHSIRLSALNARQRVDLVHQLSEGLEIYHRGGIKPEAVAELLLMAAQVGALGFIGAQQ